MLINSNQTIFKVNERRWFNTAWGLSFSVVVLYVILHFLPGMPDGGEIRYLDKEHLSTINNIFTVTVTDIDANDKEVTIPKTDDSRKEAAIFYTAKVLGITDVNSEEYEYIEKVFEKYSYQQLTVILPSIPFRVNSFFWLTSSLIYLEIIFWSLFGVGASLLYKVSEAISNRKFIYEKVPIHFAKLIYAPLSAIVIFFSIDVFLYNGSIVVDNVSNWVIVLAFILGFFSGRTVELLRRLKDILLPLGGENDLSVQNQSSSDRGNTLKGRVSFSEKVVAPPPGHIHNTTIMIHSKDESGIPKIVNPDENGVFEFRNITSGNYILEAEVQIEDKIFKVEKHIIFDSNAAEQEEVELLLESGPSLVILNIDNDK